MSRTGAGDRLTAAGLHRLLDRLDPDRDRAGRAYEDLRHALVRFFDWRGGDSPEESADEVLDRLAQKLDDAATPILDVRRYAHGIARMVLLEGRRRAGASPAQVGTAELDRLPAAPETPTDGRPQVCLERCLAQLAEEGRALILRYYDSPKGRAKIEARQHLAASLGLSDNALRSRAQRLRDRLERCVRGCLGEAAPLGRHGTGPEHTEG